VFYLPNLDTNIREVAKAVIEMLEIEYPFILDILGGIFSGGITDLSEIPQDEETGNRFPDGHIEVFRYDYEKLIKYSEEKDYQKIMSWAVNKAKRFLIRLFTLIALLLCS